MNAAVRGSVTVVLDAGEVKVDFVLDVDQATGADCNLVAEILQGISYRIMAPTKEPPR